MHTDVYIPQASASLGIIPESFDTAEVRARYMHPDDEHPTVSVDLHGVLLQTYRSDPLKVAAALQELAGRIAEAGAEARNLRNSGVQAA